MLSVIFVALWSTQQFLKFNERHKKSLSQLSKSKTHEIALFRKLNGAIADLSSAIEGSDLFQKFSEHLQNVFQVEDCAIFVRESKGPYEKRFQKTLGVFPDILDLPLEFDHLLKEGVLPSRNANLEEAEILSWFDPHVKNILDMESFYLMRSVLHESGKSTSILVIMKGPENLIESEVMEYALAGLVGQFAMSYDKAILLRRAEDANLMKSSFLANMSHEIRTPFGGDCRLL